MTAPNSRARSLARIYNGLRRQMGRSAVIPDPDLPTQWLIGTLFVTSLELLRGVVRTRRLVFIGSRVRLRGAARIMWGRGSRVGRGSTIDGYATDSVIFGPGSRLGDYSVVTCTSHVTKVGKGVTIGPRSGFGDYCHMGASGGITIGSDVIGGPYVSFHSQDHVFGNPAQLIRDQGVTERGIVVGDDCWIGARTTFLDGAEIGEHCVVAAGAVVKGTFPDRVVIGGIPARILAYISDEASP